MENEYNFTFIYINFKLHIDSEFNKFFIFYSIYLLFINLDTKHIGIEDKNKTYHHKYMLKT